MHTYTCTGCSVQFSSARLGLKFCSPSCRLSSYVKFSHRGIKASCAQCGAEFDKIRPHKKFCSSKCRGKNASTITCRRNVKYRGASIENFLTPLARKTLGRKKNIDVDAAHLIDLFRQQNGRCAVSNVPLTYETGRGRVFTNASVDRIDSNIGYRKDNVRLVCHIVNLMKNTMTDDELRQWCKLILDNK